MVVSHQARWRAYFAINALQPLTIIYEDLMDDPAAAVTAVGRLMHLPETPRANPALVDLRIQRDALSEAWRERFLAEHGDVTVPLALDMHNLPYHPPVRASVSA
jgi:LPS sulfotransferase NodH